MKTKAGTIVVGVDGSDSSQRALAWATDQALAEGRELTLAHAIHDITTAYADAAILYPEAARSQLMAAGRKIVEAARNEVQARAPELEVHEVLVEGDRLVVEVVFRLQIIDAHVAIFHGQRTGEHRRLRRAAQQQRTVLGAFARDRRFPP